MKRKASDIGYYRHPSSSKRAVIITVVCCIVILFIAAVIFSFSLITTSSVSHTTDPHYTGDRIAMESFETVKSYYPDTEMAEHIDSLAAEDQLEELNVAYSGISLYYKHNKAWDKPKYWYSLQLHGVSYPDEEGIYQQISLFCMFTGTIDKWKATEADETGSTIIGGTEVTLETNSSTQCCYAYFETNNIIYELRVQYGNNASMLQSVLNILLT